MSKKIDPDITPDDQRLVDHRHENKKFGDISKNNHLRRSRKKIIFFDIR